MDDSADSSRIAELEAERDALRAHILDIDAHATPYGDIPGEPGWVGTYLVTAGALHRALGRIGHTAPKCQAEAERDALKVAVERVRALHTVDGHGPVHAGGDVIDADAWCAAGCELEDGQCPTLAALEGGGPAELERP